MSKRRKKTPAQRHEDDLKRLSKFRPIDDTFMRALFRDNVPLAQLVLRIILGKDDLMVTSCETQADMKRVTGARSVCLDAYATDNVGKKYDIEVQRDDDNADPHRARYHSSVMDVENLDENQPFTALPDTYVIFITEHDYYDAGEPLYVIQQMNITLNQPFGDGTHILYVNGQYRGDSEMGKLMHDFCCADPDEMYYMLFADKTRYLKESTEGVSEMCRAMEELREESFEEGREIGREDTMYALVQALKTQGKSVKEIEQTAALMGYTPEDVAEWLAPETTV